MRQCSGVFVAVSPCRAGCGSVAPTQRWAAQSLNTVAERKEGNRRAAEDFADFRTCSEVSTAGRTAASIILAGGVARRWAGGIGHYIACRLQFRNEHADRQQRLAAGACFRAWNLAARAAITEFIGKKCGKGSQVCDRCVEQHSWCGCHVGPAWGPDTVYLKWVSA